MTDYNAFDADALAVSKRAAMLWKRDPTTAKRLTLAFLDVDLSPLGRTVFEDLCGSMDDESFDELAGVRAGLVATVVRKNPQLAIRPRLWEGPVDRQRELWDTLKGTEAWSSLELDWGSIVRTMLRAGADALADDVVSECGAYAVNAIMGWAEESGGGFAVSEPWRRALAERPTDLVKWLQTNESARLDLVSLVASLLDPDSGVIQQVGFEFWLKLAKRGVEAVPAPIELMAFLLCVGFENGRDQAAELVVHTFEPVHDAAWDNILSSRAWSILERRVPRIWREWDRCERLRRALIDRFLKNGWFPGYLLRAVRRDRTFDLIMEYYYWRASGGRKFIETLVQGISEGTACATDSQRAALARYAQRLR